MFSGFESRLPRHIRCRHRLPVDRHHRRPSWKLHSQGMRYKADVETFSKRDPVVDVRFTSCPGHSQSRLPGARVWLLQQRCAMWGHLHRHLHPNKKLHLNWVRKCIFIYFITLICHKYEIIAIIHYISIFLSFCFHRM